MFMYAWGAVYLSRIKFDTARHGEGNIFSEIELSPLGIQEWFKVYLSTEVQQSNIAQEAVTGDASITHVRGEGSDFRHGGLQVGRRHYSCLRLPLNPLRLVVNCKCFLCCAAVVNIIPSVVDSLCVRRIFCRRLNHLNALRTLKRW